MKKLTKQSPGGAKKTKAKDLKVKTGGKVRGGLLTATSLNSLEVEPVNFQPKGSLLGLQVEPVDFTPKPRL